MTRFEAMLSFQRLCRLRYAIPRTSHADSTHFEVNHVESAHFNFRLLHHVLDLRLFLVGNELKADPLSVDTQGTLNLCCVVTLIGDCTRTVQLANIDRTVGSVVV